jgi:hypothetical protein
VGVVPFGHASVGVAKLSRDDTHPPCALSDLARLSGYPPGSLPLLPFPNPIQAPAGVGVQWRAIKFATGIITATRHEGNIVELILWRR